MDVVHGANLVEVLRADGQEHLCESDIPELRFEYTRLCLCSAAIVDDHQGVKTPLVVVITLIDFVWEDERFGMIKESALPRGLDGMVTSRRNVQSPPHNEHLQSVVTPTELHDRESRPADYQAESQALVALAEAMANSPRSVLQKLADALLKLCRAHPPGSAFWKRKMGTRFSLARRGWAMVRLSRRDNARRGQPLWHGFGSKHRFAHLAPGTLLSDPSRSSPAIAEVLLMPFHVAGQAVGTIWAIAHDESRKFDGEDERLIGSLGKFASSAYQSLKSLDALQFELRERTKTEEALRRE